VPAPTVIVSPDWAALTAAVIDVYWPPEPTLSAAPLTEIASVLTIKQMKKMLEKGAKILRMMLLSGQNTIFEILDFNKR
jgi:hypothetical protein